MSNKHILVVEYNGDQQLVICASEKEQRSAAIRHALAGRRTHAYVRTAVYAPGFEQLDADGMPHPTAKPGP